MTYVTLDCDNNWAFNRKKWPLDLDTFINHLPSSALFRAISASSISGLGCSTASFPVLFPLVSDAWWWWRWCRWLWCCGCCWDMADVFCGCSIPGMFRIDCANGWVSGCIIGDDTDMCERDMRLPQLGTTLPEIPVTARLVASGRADDTQTDMCQPGWFVHVWC